MNREYILEAIDITKKFPGVLANDSVYLNVRYGEILGLIGENGAGKSTLLKILNGIYPYGTYEGKLILEGKEITPKNTSEAMQEGIGYVPQETNVLKNFSVAENIYISDLQLSKKNESKKSPFINFEEMYKACECLLKENNIDLDPYADVKKLSVGQQQMLMIARALAMNPKVLILDESTTSLSASDVEKLFEVVRNLKNKGISIIFVTHKMDEILELTDRVTILRDGKNISTYEKKEYNTARIIADMIGRELSQMYPERRPTIGEEVLRVEGVTIEHPYISGRNLVENVSFCVRAGEVLGLGGLVGAGRSEVCLAVYGMLPIKKGRIFMNGKEIHIRNSSDAVRQGISMVSEDRKRYGLNFVWGIQDNIIISNLKAVSKSFFVSQKTLSERAQPYYKDLRIKAPSLRTKVGTLSGGNQQKVVIARALNAEPKVVILDEPTKGIDVGSKNEIYQLINDLTSQGVAIIMISSELPELLSMSDRYVIMAEGRVAGELSKEEASDANIMYMATKTFRKSSVNAKESIENGK